MLAVYNGSGFVAVLVLPAYADRKGNYLWPLLACGVLTLALADLLFVTSSFPIAVIGLLVLGGPAGVGSSLLFGRAVLNIGVAAGLEIPALLMIGRLSYRFSKLRLIASGCVVGIAYYAAMVFVPGPVLLIGLQVLDAWFFAVVAGIGLTLFQQIIPRPGLASGLFVNTRRLGAIVLLKSQGEAAYKSGAAAALRLRQYVKW